MPTAAGRLPMGKTVRTRRLMATTIAANMDRAPENVPCTISATIRCTPMCCSEFSIGRKQSEVDEERLLESILKAGDKERAAAMKKHATAELSKGGEAQGRAGQAVCQDVRGQGLGAHHRDTTSICCRRNIRPEQLELEEKIQKHSRRLLAESKQTVEDAKKMD